MDVYFISHCVNYLERVTPVRRESASASQRSFRNKIAGIAGKKLHQTSIQSVREGLPPILYYTKMTSKL